MVADTESSSGYFWAARLVNSSPVFAFGDVVVTAAFRDSSGRLVGTDKTYSFIAPTLAAGVGGWVGGRTSIESEVPSSVKVVATGTVLPGSALRPFSPIDVRTVFVPPSYEGDTTDIRVRGEAENPNRSTVSAALFVATFDASGRLLTASNDYTEKVPAGARAPVDVSMGTTGPGVPARLEFFAPPIAP